MNSDQQQPTSPNHFRNTLTLHQPPYLNPSALRPPLSVQRNGAPTVRAKTPVYKRPVCFMFVCCLDFTCQGPTRWPCTEKVIRTRLEQFNILASICRWCSNTRFPAASSHSSHSASTLLHRNISCERAASDGFDGTLSLSLLKWEGSVCDRVSQVSCAGFLFLKL